MQTTSNSSLNGQPHKLVSTTSSESPSPLKQNLAETGQKCTKCGKSEPEVQFYTRGNSYGTPYTRAHCKNCYAVGRRGMRTAIKKAFGAAAEPTIIAHRPPVGTPCRCCGTPMGHGKGKHDCNFDHDPFTNTFRGWICKNCNTSIGGLGDSIEGVERALKYLYETTH